MPEPVVSASDATLRSHVDRVLNVHYELDREIGRGGMGIVYLARDRRLKRQVAVKLLPPELAFRSEIRSRFLREAETAAQLSHPNIVPIYAVDEREGLVFFVMAYVRGDNLAKRLHDQGPMDVKETRRILCEVSNALAYAHSRNVVHRDIKPDNILLDAETGRAMVTDFGIARALSEGGEARLTATGIAIGTPAYMSPEQAAGDREIDGRTDLYSLGILGYQMLVGEPPFTGGSTPALLVKHISERPVPIDQRRAGVPTDLSRAVMMLLEKDPANRFQSASSLVTALETGNVPDVAPTGLMYPGARSVASSSWESGSPGRSSPAGLAPAAGPTAEELTRWNASMVTKFRGKLAPYFAVNAILLPVGILGDGDFLGVSVMWSIYIAYKYAKLWAEGYDWHDVFKQPKDRMFVEVTAEAMDDVRALFDRKKREEVRERDRARVSHPLFATDSPQPALPGPDLTAVSGPHADAVRQAAADRDEIVRLVETMPRSERDQIPEVVPTARALQNKIQMLAITLAELERGASPQALDGVEREITTLESQANPLDRVASEERVRRLAILKRQRRAMADGARKREQAAARLEHCRLALQNMRFDVLRLRTGTQSHQNVTLIAEQAMSLARDMDGLLGADEELARMRAAARPSERGTSRA